MLNVAIIMGRLTAEPELKSTQSGIAVCSFRVAVDRRFKGQNEERQADFINVVAWRQTAEFVSRYFGKGSMIAVQGSIQVRSYEDKNGIKREAVEIVAENVSFAGEQKQSVPTKVPPAASRGRQPNSTDNDFEEIPEDDDLPF